VADEQKLTPKQTGLLSALDFWMYAAEAMYWAANKQNDPDMEAVSKAQAELEKIEQQIEQLQGAAGNNPEAVKQLQTLHDRVDALRRQMSGQ
jgi:capsule polysaccharide export protein KpsE/RkpR